MQILQTQNIADIFLLVGYLGSGKTTFIKKLLLSNVNLTKIAVIQNQFAQQMGIQSPIITNNQGTPFSNFMELPNGCICCSAKNDLLSALQYLVQVSNVKKIFVQTNGVADPAQSIKQFWLDENMKLPIRLHSIICMIPLHRFDLLKNENIFNKHLIYANKCVLSFIDKVEKQQVKRIQQILTEINSSIQVYKQIFGQSRSDDQFLFNNIMEGELFHINDLLKIGESKQEKHKHHEIDSFILKGVINCSYKKFQQKIGRLIWQQQNNLVMRIKGLIIFKNQSNYFELQGQFIAQYSVDQLFQIKQSSVKVKQFAQQSKILIIGKKLQKNHIQLLLFS